MDFAFGVIAEGGLRDMVYAKWAAAKALRSLHLLTVSSFSTFD